MNFYFYQLSSNDHLAHLHIYFRQKFLLHVYDYFYIIGKSFYNMYNLGKSYLSGGFFIFFICSNVLINLYHFILLW